MADRGVHGIICGCDAAQEWLLDWWWSRYSECNAFPVTFFDFGMSSEARKRCQKRGKLITLKNANQMAMFPYQGGGEQIVEFKRAHGEKMWEYRKAWFCKPLAMLQSPYERSLWLDLDCEVMQSLSPLVSFPLGETDFAAVRGFRCEDLPPYHQKVFFNSGVVLFKRGAKIIEKWARMALQENENYLGDDHILSQLILRERLALTELPYEFNWHPGEGINFNALVVHWIGKEGKKYIKEKGGFKTVFKELYRVCQQMDEARLQGKNYV